MGRIKSMKTWQGDACIVAVARLVSLWRDTCSYNGAHAACLFHVRQSLFCDKALFSAPDRGSFGVSICCALWRFGPRREPSQLLCFLMPCIASKFHATSFFLFRILFRILFWNLFRNFKNVRKHRISCDSLIFMVASIKLRKPCAFSGFEVSE